MDSGTFEGGYLTANGLRLHYLDGSGEGRPMLLLHGITSHAHSWDLFAASVRPEYRVVALDQRGHGDSEWADSYTSEDFASDAAEVIRQLGLGRVILIGISMGGNNAIVLATGYSDLVEKLVIVDAAPELAPAGVRRLQYYFRLAPRAFNSADEALSPVRKANPRFSDEFVRNMGRGLRRREDGR